MAKAKIRLKPYDFVLPYEKDEDDHTIWKLKPLTGSEKELCMTATDNGLRFTPDKYDKALKLGLIGWEKYNDENGTPVEFNKENFDQIETDDRVLLAFEIFYNTNLSGEQSKNS